MAKKKSSKTGAKPDAEALMQTLFRKMEAEKTAEGLQAIEWYKQGKLAEIAEYCLFDVKITKLVHEYGAAHKKLHYTNKFGNKLTVEVDWEA